MRPAYQILVLFIIFNLFYITVCNWIWTSKLTSMM